MTLTEFYDKAGGNYEEVLCRLMNDALVKKFLIKFLDDESCKNIFDNLEKHDIKEAFRAAHTLKGICQNLGLGTLYKSSCDVTEALRDGKNDVTDKMLSKLKDDYEMTVSTIESL